jgi:hypothetical protein
MYQLSINFWLMMLSYDGGGTLVSKESAEMYA